MKIYSTKKEILKDFLLPLLIQYLILAILMVTFYLFAKIGPLLQEPRMVGDEISSPTLGRLLYGFISFAGFIVLAIFASKKAKIGEDTKAFWFGITAGILLWQSVGEISWHFQIGGVNFVPLENITSFPIVVVMMMIFIYGRKNHSFDWGIWILFLSFMCNWIGHYCTIGIYPFFAKLIERHTFIVIVSLVVGTLGMVCSIIYLIKRARTKRGRMIASVFTFISIAIIAFAFI